MSASPSTQLDELAVVVQTLTETLGGSEDVDEVLDAVCHQIVLLLPDADLASVTLARSGRRPTTAASTDRRATRLEQRQYAAGDGPCLTAARTGRLVRGVTATEEARWPGFVDEADAVGVRSFLAAPLAVDDRLNGALNLFSAAPHGFRDVDVTVIDLYTTVASSIVRSTSRYSRAVDVIGQLDRALDTRAVIEQAKGILMATHRIGEDAAFRLLVEHSQTLNKKLHLVAEEFVANASG
jgi:GAF domain-containing protein